MRKTVQTWNGSAYVTSVDRKFIYDGWNLLTERDATTLALVANYVWGLDLSKTLQDGGGVGGLLAVLEANGTTHLTAYDGNGNVAALVNKTTGALTAAYEYDAFGQTIRATGSLAAFNPFRFSTKYTDSETGLLYYGRRYYNPQLGRWLGRDPIEERGGLHLYGFVGNNGVNKWDVLGMCSGEWWDTGNGYEECEESLYIPGRTEGGLYRVYRRYADGFIDVQREDWELGGVESGRVDPWSTTQANPRLGAASYSWDEDMRAAEAESLRQQAIEEINRILSALNNAPPGGSANNLPAPAIRPTAVNANGVERINAGNYSVLTDGRVVQINVAMGYFGSAATPEVIAKFNEGIEMWWSGEFGKYSVRTFANAASNGQGFVTLVVPGDGRSNPTIFFANSDGWTAAHEVGHRFGLGDQYNSRTGQPYPGYENNIMGAPGMPPSEDDINRILETARARAGKR